MTDPTTTQTAIVPAHEAEAITRWEALAYQIAQASQEAEGKVFHYRTPADNKAARSYIASLRRLKGNIERARKDAKGVHLERGREVDNTARTLEGAVQGLIEPHQRELDAIAAEEEYRIAQHRAVLDRIAALVEGVTTADVADDRLLLLASIDTSGLEEFRTAGEARHAEAQAKLLELRDTLRQQEADQAELEALRAERAARDQAERDERIRQEAIEAEQAESQQREQAALAAAEAARQAQEAAEQREREALAAAEAAQRAEEARQAVEAARVKQAKEAQLRRRNALRQELADAIALHGPAALPDLIIAGRLHPAVVIDWNKA
jgi:colicin import membrane protein